MYQDDIKLISGSIKDWKKFQHFKDRNPPWIKLYRTLLDDIEWHNLDGDSAKMLVMLWLLASESKDGTLPDNQKIAFRLRITENKANQTLEKLSHWIDITTISERYQDGPTETETETETQPSRNRQTIPYQEIRALYHKILPELPECKKLTEKRRAYIRARWNNGLPDLEHWEKFFTAIRGSQFLMGNTAATNGRTKPFIADLEWLTNATNYLKIYEGKYHE